MKQVYYTIFILVLGLAFSPASSYAWGSASGKSCCKKEVASKTKVKKCCKKASHETGCKENCGGKCGDKACNCVVLQTTFTIPILDVLAYSNLELLHQKQKFPNLAINLTDGYYSIWTPPNII